MMLTDVNAADHHDQILPESQINRLHEPNAECEFSVHQDGPDGPIVKGNRALKHLCFFDTVDKVSKIDGICSIIKYNIQAPLYINNCTTRLVANANQTIV
jgi:hypothetical protein